ncbi:MAG: hypothetical protein ACOCVF_01240 [bacterium]
MFYKEVIIDDNGEMIIHSSTKDGLVIYDNKKTHNNSAYTDRLYQWDSKKHDKFCKKHFNNTGQYWNNREPEKIEMFLRDYWNDQSIVLCSIIEYENQSTGYPVWRIDFHWNQKNK